MRSWGIATDDRGGILVTDEGKDLVRVFTATGTTVARWGGYGLIEGKFISPRGIAVDAAGNVYVVDTENHRIQKFVRKGGVMLTPTATATATPTAPPVLMVPGGAGAPTSTAGDGKYNDVNGNGRVDFADAVLHFNQMNWIAANEPAAAFDYNGNGRIDFADVVWLFNHL